MPFSFTLIGFFCLGSSLVIEIESSVVPFAAGANWTTTVALELAGMVSAPALLRMENGGSLFGEPTLTCKVPLPVSRIVMLAVAVAPGAAWKFKVCGDTTM